MIGIGLPRSTIISTRGTSVSLVVTRTTTISTVQTGFGLFALFNNLSIYLFNASRAAAKFKINESHSIRGAFLFVNVLLFGIID